MCFSLIGEYSGLLFIFFACPKKTNQKKGHPCFLSAFSGFPVRLQSCRDQKNSPAFGVLRQLLILFRQLFRCSAAIQWGKAFNYKKLITLAEFLVLPDAII